MSGGIMKSAQKSFFSPFSAPTVSRVDVNAYGVAGSMSEWIDEWSFKGFNTDVYTHKIHRYPAMFIPQLVRKLIEVYSNKNDIVLDIFNGSGSTLVETKLTGRHGVGIEINPLAVLISKVKITPIDFVKAEKSFEMIEADFFARKSAKKVINFDNIDYWFSPNVIDYISLILNSINNLKDKDIADFFKVCLSEIIREVSWCIHSGFKMHRDVNKVNNTLDKQSFFDKLTNVIVKNIEALKSFTADSISSCNANIIFGDSTHLQKSIKPASVDLILTSPPYGDSQTTVAYGQFSRLSSQVLGLEALNGVDIPTLDKELLGGKRRKLVSYTDIISRSITLANIQELYTLRINNSDNKDEKKKLELRLLDILSFYKDLDETLKNGSVYLKTGKHFVLVTGSRVVKLVKLHTDLIIAELGEKHNLTLSAIFYRNIENKRMPSKVSATNITGETAPTMTRESIIVLRKIA